MQNSQNAHTDTHALCGGANLTNVACVTEEAGGSRSIAPKGEDPCGASLRGCGGEGGAEGQASRGRRGCQGEGCGGGSRFAEAQCETRGWGGD